MLETHAEAGGRGRVGEEPAPGFERIVQLPLDGHDPPARSAVKLHEVFSLPFAASFRTVLVSVIALSRRLGYQDTIAIDCYLQSRRVQGETAVAERYDVALDPSDTVVTLAERLESLAACRASDTGAPGGPPSNLALVMVDLPPDAAGESLTDQAERALDQVPGHHDLMWIVLRDAQTAHCAVAADARRLSDRAVTRLVRSFQVVLGAILSHPSQAIDDLPLLGEEDLAGGHASVRGEDLLMPLVPVPLQFASMAAAHPTETAVTFGHRSYSYRELDDRSARLASYLVAQGVGPGVHVGVCLPPSLEVPEALLAVLRAGGVYVPLDPSYPAPFLAAIIRDAEPRIVLSHSTVSSALPAEVARLLVDRADDFLADVAPLSVDDVWVDLAHPSTLIFTSGTTGKPKGVVATHANLAHYLQVARDRYRFAPGDVFSSLARYTFSISLFELLSPLCCGGTLRLLEREEVLMPHRLARALQNVTVVHAGPSLLGNLFRYLQGNPAAPQTFPNIRHASSGGDLVAPHLMEQMKRAFCNAELFVIYGCTEISCMGLTYEIPRDRKVSHSFVGKPFPHVDVGIRDPKGRSLPVGVVGEIFFAGRGVSRGYLHQPELTAERYLAEPGRILYKTGDLGRLHDDGNIEILGRRDFQVQLRGIRIELAGIENTIRETKLANQCAVVMRRHGEGDERLIAFVVDPSETNTARFRKVLAERLPDYMLPQAVVVLDALPLTPNGKLDRRGLQSLPLPRADHEDHPIRVMTPLERKIGDAFAQILHLDPARIGPDDGFFDLGGHSLSAVLLIGELENSLGLGVSAGDLFEHGTPRALASFASVSFSSAPRPIPLSNDTDKPALFMLAGVHLYRELARQLEGEYSVYGVYVGRELEMLDRGRKFPKLEVLAKEYLEVIQRSQPQGPYRLGAMSFGGIVAYEVVRQLRAQGEEVAFLGLIDAVLPELGWHRMAQRARRLARLPVGRMVGFLQDRVAERRSRLFGPQQPVRAHAEFVRHDPQAEAAVASMEDLRQEAYETAARDYARRVTSCSLRAVLVASGRRLARAPLEDPQCGWGELIPDLTVASVDADHLALLEPPHVSQLAASFRAGLERRPRAPTETPRAGLESSALSWSAGGTSP